MTFLKSHEGNFYPLSFKQDSLGAYTESVLFKNRALHGIYERVQKDHARFANVWMKNIKEQQGL